MKKQNTAGLRFLVCVILALLYATNAHTQASDGMTKQDFLPPSPDVAALGRYGEVPVNLSTGVPNISIPIYEIREGNLTLPISLSYNASGIKVQQEATMVGLGWNLNAGGAITRIVRGIADESPDGFFNSRETVKSLMNAQFSYFETQNKNFDVVQGKLDGEPDLFICSIGGLNFKFSMNIDGEFETIPQSNYKISYNQSSQNEPWTGTWSITDEQGNGYYFGGKVNAPIPYYLVERLKPIQVFDDASVTSWFINFIKPSTFTHTNTDRITFEYILNEQKGPKVYIESVHKPLSGCYTMFPSPMEGVYRETYYKTVVLQKIKWAQGEVRLLTTKDRLDNGFLHRLNSISIYNSQFVLAKTCLLEHGYFNHNFPNKRLKLKSAILGVENLQHNITLEIINPPKYQFEYDETTPLPDIDELSQDLWGYYNGYHNSTLIPSVKVPVPQMYGTLLTYTSSGYRAVNPVFITRGTLKRITYPTGGYTEFDFEPNTQGNYNMDERLLNQTKDSNGNFYFAGLRIKRISTYDPYHPGKVNVKRFLYDDENGHSTGRIMEIPIYAFFQRRTVEERFIVGISPVSVIHNFCDYVVIKQNSQFNLVGASGEIVYTKVEVFHGENGENGKTVTEFNFLQNILSEKQRYLPFSAVWPLTWKHNQSREDEYKKQNGAFALHSEAENNYTSVRHSSNIKGYRVGILKLYQVYRTDSGMAEFDSDIPINNEYVTDNEVFYSDFTYVTRQTTKSYSSDNTEQLIREVNTEIDDVSLQPKSVTTTNSEGMVEEVRSKYAGNYQLGTIHTNTPYPIRAIAKLQEKNILGAPVEVTKIVNDHVVSSSGTIYHTEVPKPLQTYSIKADQPIPVSSFVFSDIQGDNVIYDQRYEANIAFTHYDNQGNPLMLKQKDGPASGYFWDYNNSLPVANIKLGNPERDMYVVWTGNPHTDIFRYNYAYTSFEGENSGHWEGVNPVGIQDAMGPMGRKVYNLSAGNLQFLYDDGKGTLSDYYLYLWHSPDAQIQVNAAGGPHAVEALFVNPQGWKLIRYTLKSCNSVDISGSGQIDEVRLFTTDSRMTSYAHIPGLGVQCQADENGQIQYYYYDDFARLSYVKDMEGNILKTIDYQFQK